MTSHRCSLKCTRFRVDRARELLADEGTVDEWRAGYEFLWLDVEARVLPRLSETLAGAVEREYAGFLREVEFEPVLVHRDLGVEHILVGERPAIIDFEDVAVGDPAIDFVGIFNAFGLTAARAVIEHYGPVDRDFAGRLRFYRWMGSVHAALYALDIDDPELLAGALEQIEVRIADRPRASAAVLRDDRILMVRYLDQFWTLPGGGVEPGEEWEDAAVRELREEAGISGGVVRELYRRTYGQGSEVCFLVQSDGEPAVTNDPDITAVRWFPSRRSRARHAGLARSVPRSEPSDGFSGRDCLAQRSSRATESEARALRRSRGSRPSRRRRETAPRGARRSARPRERLRERARPLRW